jgi:hypothetical protein
MLEVGIDRLRRELCELGADTVGDVVRVGRALAGVFNDLPEVVAGHGWHCAETSGGAKRRVRFVC